MSLDKINLILFSKKPYFDKKNKVDGLALPNSSTPINVKLCFGYL